VVYPPFIAFGIPFAFVRSKISLLTLVKT